MKTPLDTDSPWHRLPWTLPIALLVLALALWGLAYFMEESGNEQVEPLPIDARLIEQRPPVAIQPERPIAVHKPKPEPRVRPQQASVAPRVSPPAEQNPAARKAEATNNTGVSVLTAAPGAGGVPGEGQVPTGGSTPASGGNQAGPSDAKGSSHGGNIYANSEARAIFRPEPQIPDDLRENAFKFTGLVLFHIEVDGSVKVDLAKPTPNPRLNRILLDTYGKWRFIPKVVNGKPVASTFPLVINLEVK